MNIRRLFVEKKTEFNIEARALLKDIKESLGINDVKNIRLINRYDIKDMGKDEYEKLKYTVFAEKTVDFVYDEDIPDVGKNRIFAVQYLPGQYDQRADSASQCIQILTQKERIDIVSSKVYVIEGNITEEEFNNIKNYCINPVDSREASLEKLTVMDEKVHVPQNVEILDGFIEKTEKELSKFLEEKGLAMSLEDLEFCRDYFKSEEKRNPTITEIKVIDTYWSDHCRHTTFMTELKNVKIEEGKFSVPIKNSYDNYLKFRSELNREGKPVCLMDIATIAMRKLKAEGKLEDLDESEEINACSIVVDVDVDDSMEKWLVMFKNETHNHPTEIEPFGGAATCIGGAIRDPLSGRSYVYQAMRVTGSGDPTVDLKSTLEGKLPQKKITTGAAQGYSSYGNQIGLATGLVNEIYDPGYIAKRMEIGAVVGAAPAENVVRKRPEASDIVILLGGRTGRDGCGGATGSSKKHTEKSILTSGAEVQKGNPVTERKLQRLFRKHEVSRLIKRCNDFGAGGVSVAIGELAEGLDINLDLVPKKYEGLDGTELAISESQERMAVVVSKDDKDRFIKYAEEENLEATAVAVVTDTGRMRLYWREKLIVDLSRKFIDTNGVRAEADVLVKLPDESSSYFDKSKYSRKDEPLKKRWLDMLGQLNVCSQKGLVERFDSTIGANTVLMPFGGKYQFTRIDAMAAKLPVLSGNTDTATIMSYGYNPDIAKWSPFHGAVYAVCESVAKVVAAGGKAPDIRLTFQEYFGSPQKEPERWGKPFSALLGALYAQKKFNIAAIGGKDSMSGTFKDMDVPPTLVSFAITTENADVIISPEFKQTGSSIVIVPTAIDKYGMPDFEMMNKNYEIIHSLIEQGSIISAETVKDMGIARTVSNMSFGNKIGIKLSDDLDMEELFFPYYGSIIAEIDKDADIEDVLRNIDYKLIGVTHADEAIEFKDESIAIDDMIEVWSEPLEKVFPMRTEKDNGKIDVVNFEKKTTISPVVKIVKPRVFIPVFPGTNCEYDSERAFISAGAEVDTLVLRNLNVRQIEESIDEIVDRIKNSQIIMFPGGFSAGDEPDGSGKFIADVFRNSKIKFAVDDLLNRRDGLMLGICNGFQALIKLGLVPFGDIRDIKSDYPTLTYNKIGRHISRIVNTRIASNLSPWLKNVNVGDIHSIAISHGEGRFIASENMIRILIDNGQIATQYVDFQGNPSYRDEFNPNGSFYAVEGITSPDGRILGKMGHSERIGKNVIKNIPGDKDQKIFEAGVGYFRL
ncbi:phosphoribosylformylglycinamidine synthase [Clostridium sp. LBM24168]